MVVDNVLEIVTEKNWIAFNVRFAHFLKMNQMWFISISVSFDDVLLFKIF